MAAKRTRCSPAGPMAMASASAPSASISAFTASRVDRPHSSGAGFTCAPLSSTLTYDGAAARPVMTTASKPVRLSVAGKRPPKVESKKSPVSGDLAATGAAVAGHGRVGDGPDREDHGVGGIERVDARGHVVEQYAGGQAIAAEQRARRVLGQRHDAGGPVVQSTNSMQPPYPCMARLSYPVLPAQCGETLAGGAEMSTGRSFWASSLR
jgi:hypothetical protein